MQALRESFTASSNSIGWIGPDPCEWIGVECNDDGRVVSITIKHRKLKASLPQSLANLTALKQLDLTDNDLTGELPRLPGMSSLRHLFLCQNGFSSVPSDFFQNLTSLERVSLDRNPLSAWSLPNSLRSARNLVSFTAYSANLNGKIPGFIGKFRKLKNLSLEDNYLEGELPASFANSTIRSLRLNDQRSKSKLNGSLAVLRTMTICRKLRLDGNSFSGPLPNFSRLKSLQHLNVRDNFITGPVPPSLQKLRSLKTVNLSNNLLQGPTPYFDPASVAVDLLPDSNSFCSPTPGVSCLPMVDTLLAIAKSFGYPKILAEKWKRGNPCDSWIGITCVDGSISVINFQQDGLSGVISANFSSITSLQTLILAGNNLTGTIPIELRTLPNLKVLDVSHNHLHGKIPPFDHYVLVITDGNPDLSPPLPAPNRGKIGVEIGLIASGVAIILLTGLAALCYCSGKKGGKKSCHLDLIEGGRMEISLKALNRATNNFSAENILGRGGFGTVYRGILNDGSKIAVKKMDSLVLVVSKSKRGLDEFKSEIDVLTKVRHRHLVSLLGYCLDRKERALVYEFMEQGSLSRHLFNWKVDGLKPLEWSKRLTIALDVARGIEYLHGFAHRSFVHRDLKPSNILLGDDFRAKVADFGLVRLAPDGKSSVITRVAGTFGYIDPEYAVTGRVTTKIDVFSFGVILMELITGRRAVDESRRVDSGHLVTWFRGRHLERGTFHEAIDSAIVLDEETLASIRIVAELASHCCAPKSAQRPDIGHAVNVLSALVELWRPAAEFASSAVGEEKGEALPDDEWQRFIDKIRAQLSSYGSPPSGETL
ncbi:LOW QUALITY PROTEIN: receptor protein kinase TMK1-like [Diospyros lotus]|uniref:LOW QUALITY PROTEIN: receptor protein kinase TMK1-like n=1 Tax=Diospyros lotus TaxID=55363 RepID=UPI002252DAB7|nr:LOW QUALITY PROTEIN: receptor protein kinase TMK1-like [Diospyros lotus]